MSENKIYQQQTLFAEDSLANLTVLPGSEEARMMTVTSGLNILGLLTNSGRGLLLERTFLGSSPPCSTRFFLTWRGLATRRKHSLFQLAPSVPLTAETEFGLLPTPMVPNGGRSPKEMSPTGMMPDGKKRQVDLAYAIKMTGSGLWPTPAARDWKGANGPEHFKAEKRSHMGQLPNAIEIPDGNKTGLKLQPAFVEWMMGFPIGWTDLNHSETP